MSGPNPRQQSQQANRDAAGRYRHRPHEDLDGETLEDQPSSPSEFLAMETTGPHWRKLLPGSASSPVTTPEGGEHSALAHHHMVSTPL